MGKFIDLTGQKFNRLAVISRAANDSKERATWNCLCDCGNVTVVGSYPLSTGHTTSCGCMLIETRGKTSITHGQAGTPMYAAWKTMFRRCETPTNIDYDNYGGRGIKVCQEWKDFAVFRDDMGERPENATLERIDNNGNYCKNNCRWATRVDQARNRRSNIWYEFEGDRMIEIDFAARIGMKQDVVANLRRKGHTMEQILLKSKGFECGKPENEAHKPKPRPTEYKPKYSQEDFSNFPDLGRL